MSVADRIWGALTSMIKLEDEVTRQAEALKSQQSEIDNLTARVIRLEAQQASFGGAVAAKRLKGE